jgi:hypothetical protein
VALPFYKREKPLQLPDLAVQIVDSRAKPSSWRISASSIRSFFRCGLRFGRPKSPGQTQQAWDFIALVIAWGNNKPYRRNTGQTKKGK